MCRLFLMHNGRNIDKLDLRISEKATLPPCKYTVLFDVNRQDFYPPVRNDDNELLLHPIDVRNQIIGTSLRFKGVLVSLKRNRSEKINEPLRIRSIRCVYITYPANGSAIVLFEFKHIGDAFQLHVLAFIHKITGIGIMIKKNLGIVHINTVYLFHLMTILHVSSFIHARPWRSMLCDGERSSRDIARLSPNTLSLRNRRISRQNR